MTCTVAVALVVTACGDDTADFESFVTFPDAVPGDVVALRADGEDIEYIDRRGGAIYTVRPNAGVDPLIVASIEVGTEGEQRGLLGHAVIDGRRFVAFTEPGTLDLVVAEIEDQHLGRIVWSGTATQSKAVGGHLEVLDGELLLGIGSLTDWARAHGSGALVTLDPDGDSDQEPEIVSDGWNNPWAFTVTPSGEIWVADNAPDGSDLPIDQRDPEIITTSDRSSTPFENAPQRAPSAIVELPDGRIGVCGFLDGEMRAYQIVDPDGSTALERSGTVGPCQTGAVVRDDGGIVTVSVDETGSPVLLLRPD